tara:strand:+ start:3988 stop:4155 length:168 start_codon:yes stop_codon:yes gene_type:complete
MPPARVAHFFPNGDFNMHNLDWNDYFDNDREAGGDDYAAAEYLGDDAPDLDDDVV